MWMSALTGREAQEFLVLLRCKLRNPVILPTRGWRPGYMSLSAWSVESVCKAGCSELLTL